MNGETGGCSSLRVVFVGGILLTALHLPPTRAGGPVYDEGRIAFSRGDIATAYQLWKPLAEHGDADAQFALASLYYDGIGVPVDRTESSYWFLLAAKRGHAYAQYNLGNAYKRGEGVRQSDAMAVRWWKKAAGQGLSEASYNLALAYQEGAGVDKDEQTAARYFRQAAASGNADVATALAETNRPEQSSSGEAPRSEPPSGGESRQASRAANVQASQPARSSNNAATNRGAPPPGATDCEDWLAGQAPNAYTLQLMSTTRPADIEELTTEYGLSGYVVCRYTHRGRTRHALLIGTYPDIETANAAVANLPAGLKAGQPWVRRIRDLTRVVVTAAR